MQIYGLPDAQLNFIDTLKNMLELAMAEHKELAVKGDFNCDSFVPEIRTNLLSPIGDHQSIQFINESTQIIAHSQTCIDHCYITPTSLFSFFGIIALIG